MNRSDLTFRAQLIIPEQRILFDYWLSKAGKRALPARADIDPAELVPLLPTISLLDVISPGPQFRVRLAGTALRDAFGREMTGFRVRELYEGKERSYWTAALSRMVERRRPAQGVVPLPQPDGPALLQFWLRLPLSVDGRKVDMILGYDSFQTAQKAKTLSAKWLGTDGAHPHADNEAAPSRRRA